MMNVPQTTHRNQPTFILLILLIYFFMSKLTETARDFYLYVSFKNKNVFSRKKGDSIERKTLIYY
jgi:hypothetical protein